MKEGLTREANCARLLWDQFQAARKELESDIVAPRERLSSRIHSLTGSRCQDLPGPVAELPS